MWQGLPVEIGKTQLCSNYIFGKTIVYIFEQAIKYNEKNILYE